MTRHCSQTPQTELPRPANVAVIIPALNEAAAIGQVIAAIPQWVSDIIVVDNGSTDGTAEVARTSGARVVSEPRRGYGSACLAGIAALSSPEVVVFLDADFSDRPEEMDRLVLPILHGQADLVIGSRILGEREAGALTPQQRFGNWIACKALRLLYGARYTDLGPFRAIRFTSLKLLNLDDTTYGWTVQMQARAAKMGLRGAEVPVSYRRRIGQSKISGTIRGVFGAGTKILYTLGREYVRAAHDKDSGQLIVFTRFPEPGRTKTRMIPALGPKGASSLQRQMTAHTLAQARDLSRRDKVKTQVRFAGGSESAMRRLYGNDLELAPQGEGDLGQRLCRAAGGAFDAGAQSVVLTGADCPEMTSDIMHQAFAQLRQHDLVLGPAADGGYYLIGLRHAWPELFEGIAWGSDKVFQQTLDVARRLGLSVAILPVLRDVDRPEDLPVWMAVQGDSEKVPLISVIIPTFNEEQSIAQAIESAAAPGVEIIVVDGGSTDRTIEVARSHGANIGKSSRGRASQMNAGAARASGRILLFLHADTRLPPDFVRQVESTMNLPDTAAGAFYLEIEPATLAMRVIAGTTNLRSRWLRTPYGDQAIFLTRAMWNRLGGFTDIAVLEDVDLVRRASRLGTIRIAAASVQTSGRRWQQHGLWRMTLLNQLLLIAHWLGVQPNLLYHWRESGRLTFLMRRMFWQAATDSEVQPTPTDPKTQCAVLDLGCCNCYDEAKAKVVAEPSIAPSGVDAHRPSM